MAADTSAWRLNGTDGTTIKLDSRVHDAAGHPLGRAQLAVPLPYVSRQQAAVYAMPDGTLVLESRSEVSLWMAANRLFSMCF